jgi:hypothetical protein
MNIFYAIACFAITLFCAVAAINTVFGLIGHTITLASWVMHNLDWLWLPAAIGGIWYADKK